MPKPAISLDDYILEFNQRLRRHPKFREGMVVQPDPAASTIGAYGSYTFAWPKQEVDQMQAWFDARDAVVDVELQMREEYSLNIGLAPVRATPAGALETRA